MVSLSPFGTAQISEDAVLITRINSTKPLGRRGLLIVQPRVSVIMPAYNTREYIGTAITSFLRQSERETELIVIDDGSTDGTAEAVRRFTDPRIRLLVNTTCLGPSACRNKGLELARGRWIGLLDSDDWYHPERLALLAAAAEAHGVDMIVDDLQMINDGEEEPHTTLFTQYDIAVGDGLPLTLVDFVTYNIPHIKPLMRRAFLQQHALRYREEVRYAEDFLFYVDFLHAGGASLLVPQAYYCYRIRAESLSRDLLPLYAQIRTIFEQMLASDLAADPRIRQALLYHGNRLREADAYARVVMPFLQRQYGKSLTALASQPSLWRPLAALFGRAVQRRVSPVTRQDDDALA